MNLVFDVGNTKTAIACWDEEVLVGHSRVTNDARSDAARLGALVHALLKQVSVDAALVEEVTYASVVPALAQVLVQVASREFGLEPVAIDSRALLPIRLEVEEPARLGADRIVNAVAAHSLERGHTIVVDLGTATTFSCVSADGAFVGGAIAPGVGTSAQALADRTAQLPRVEISMPATVIGRRTETCLQSGIFFGAVDSVDGMVRRVRAEWQQPGVHVIATGGLSPIIAPHCRTVDEVDPLLTLRGLRIAREHHNQHFR